MKCYDCKKRIWFWQRRGVDLSSHMKCHWKRAMEILKEAEGYEHYSMVLKEIIAIRNRYVQPY